MRRRGLIALLVAAAVLAGACSTPEGPRFIDNPKNEKSGKQAHKKNKKGPRSKIERKLKGALPSDKGQTIISGDDSSFAEEDEKEPTFTVSDAAAARGSSIVDDPNNDSTKQGLAPAYAEAVQASLVGKGDEIVFTFSFAADVPEKMPDDKTYMVVGFGLRNSEDEDRSYSVGAQATHDGWTPFAGKSGHASGEQPKFPGTFDIDGNEIVMTVPWSFFGGPQGFLWLSNTAWFASVANTTHYSYDQIPNDGEFARYPKGG